jgi:hypothetical protein
MKSKVYKCDMCSQGFSRKWNAFRHNKLIHSDLAIISSNMVKPKSISSSANQKFENYKKKFDKFKKGFNYDDSFDPLAIDQASLKYIKIIGQLITPFEELEKLTSRFDDRNKAYILSNSFRSSLKSYNPVKSMNEIVEIYRSLAGRKKILQYVSKLEGVSLEYAGFIIDQEIKNASIFKRQNN